MIDAFAKMKIPIGLLNDLYETQHRDDLIKVFSRWSRDLVGADRCGIALQSDSKHLLFTVMTGDSAVVTGERYRIDDSFLGEVFSNQKPMSIRNLSQQMRPRFRALAAAGLETILIAPLAVRSQCFGTLSASYGKGHEPTPDDLNLLEALGKCLASQLVVIERMEALSTALMTDTLTKARNRRYYGSVIDRLWAGWQDNRTPFSLLLIDIDHFKRINDIHGHDAGDQILCAFVNRLRGNLRTEDKIIRIGGEEFAVAFAGRTTAQGLVIAQRLHAKIRNSPFPAGKTQLDITASFGLTEVSAGDIEHRDVFNRADAALYRAKNSGRDKIICQHAHALDLAV